jgi:DNA-binding HxlR family transcriptional regulator
MSDRDGVRPPTLDLLAEPGVAEILLALHNCGGGATLAQLRADGVAHRTDQLRRLVSSGHLHRHGAGSLDLAPGDQTTFTLSPAGEGVVRTLFRICQWGEQHAGHQDRNSRWHRLLPRRAT